MKNNSKKQHFTSDCSTSKLYLSSGAVRRQLCPSSLSSGKETNQHPKDSEDPEEIEELQRSLCYCIKYISCFCCSTGIGAWVFEVVADAKTENKQVRKKYTYNRPSTASSGLRKSGVYLFSEVLELLQFFINPSNFAQVGCTRCFFGAHEPFDFRSP